MDSKVVFPGPKAHQKEVYLSPAREKVVACGRRWGKTTLGMIMAIVGYGIEGNWRKGCLQGGNIWWVSPTYPMASDVWREIKKRLDPMIAAGYARKEEQAMRIDFKATGGSFTIKSAERPDLLRGFGLDGVVQDEAAFQSEDIYYSILRPALADKKGWWLGISTPNGHNWFKSKFEDAEARWRCTSFEAPWMDDTEKESILRDYGGRGDDYVRIAEMDSRYRQEYLAEFVAEAQGAFDPSWWRDYEAWPERRPRRLLQCWDTAFGKGEEGDFSVCVTAGEFDDGIYVRDVWRGRPSFPDLKEEAVRLYETYQPDLVLIEDKASGQSLLQELRRETSIRLHPVKADKDKRSRVNAATPLVQGGKVFLPKYAAWRAEFVKELAKFPTGRHDDQVDAFAHLVNYVRYLSPPTPEFEPPSILAGGPCFPGRLVKEGSISVEYGDIFAREEMRCF